MREGYTFNGWSDGTATYAAGASYTPNADITLTAQWELTKYKIECPTNSVNSVTTSVNKTEATMGETVTITLKNTTSSWFGSSKTVTLSINGESQTVTITKGSSKTVTFTMPASDVNITVSAQ